MPDSYLFPLNPTLNLALYIHMNPAICSLCKDSPINICSDGEDAKLTAGLPDTAGSMGELNYECINTYTRMHTGIIVKALS